MNIVIFFGLLLAGCSSAYDMAKGDEASFEDTAVGGGTDSDTGDLDSVPVIEPAWYVVRASLSVLDGVASAVDSAVTLEVIDADLARIDCTVALGTDGLLAGEVDGELGVVWWYVPVEPVEPPCAPLPAALSLGVGTLHPDARARLGAVGYDGVADSLYGAWIREEDGGPSVYGYAGTAADLTGDDAAVFPPPDGLYSLAPLYVIALPSE